MSQVLVTESSLEDIGDAIREKNGLETEYLPSEMGGAIRAIPVAPSDVMTKSVYDQNDDGVVDNSEQLEGHGANYFATATDLTALSTTVGGKMDKSVYDINDNGIVDNSEGLEGHAASYFATAEALNTLSGTVSGKMDKSIYDQNNNGIVDNAEAVNGHTVEKDVPANAVFTDTVYDDTQIKERVDDVEDDIGEINTTLETKADIDQSYSDLGSGYTTTLKPTKYNQNQEPYLFRKALGARLTSEKIVGGTVAWNQLWEVGAGETKYGITATPVTTNSDHYMNMTGTFEEPASGSDMNIYKVQNTVKAIVGHKYFIFMTPSNNFVFTAYGAFTSTRIYNNQTILQATQSGNVNVSIYIKCANGTVVNEKIRFIKCDLTLAFGTTIADHIYALEQATAGAGVAFLRNNGFMTKPYYPYCANSLESVLTSGHRTVGFNQWDEQWELGSINSSTGDNENSSSNFRSKNYIPVLPNTEYYFAAPVVLGLRFYDANKNYIGNNSAQDRTRTTPNECYYMRFVAVGATTYNHDICINISSDRNGEYEPYSEHLYPLSPVSLRGIMTLQDGKLKNDGDEYYPDGTHKERYKLVDGGTLDWTYNTEGQYFVSPGFRKTSANSNCICSKYGLAQLHSDPASALANEPDKAMYYQASNENIFIKDSAYDDATAFKAAMSGVMLVAERGTPVITQTDPYQSEQTCSKYGTEAFIDERDVPIPVGHVTDYWPDLTAKIEGLPDVTAIAPVENESKASQPYVVGKYFIHDGKFCKAKTAIATGATFTLNTNYETTTIADELYAALHS